MIIKKQPILLQSKMFLSFSYAESWDDWSNLNKELFVAIPVESELAWE
jgi:hypothetical protein